MVGPRTEIKVSASVSVAIFGSIPRGNRPALIRSGSGWCASENDRTAAFLNAPRRRGPETLSHSPSRQKMQNPSKHKKTLDSSTSVPKLDPNAPNTTHESLKIIRFTANDRLTVQKSWNRQLNSPC